MKLQAIVNQRCEDVNAFVGWPGRAHNARCFAESPVWQEIPSGDRPMHGKVLVGDSAYPLSVHVMVPYRAARPNSRESRFNLRHSRARQVRNPRLKFPLRGQTPQTLPASPSAGCGVRVWADGGAVASPQTVKRHVDAKSMQAHRSRLRFTHFL